MKDKRLPARLDVENVPPSDARRGFFERAEFEALRAALPAHLRPVVTFAYLTGWRLKSEILPLTWNRVDFKAGIVRLEPGTTKNGEGLTFPINALRELEVALYKQREATEAAQRRGGQIMPWVFHRPNGERIVFILYAWRVASRKTGLVGRIPHDFRRTGVRNMERAGVSRSVAMELVGHNTEAIYQRYAIVAEADLREGVAKLAILHAAQAGERRDMLPLATTATSEGRRGPRPGCCWLMAGLTIHD